MNRIDSAFVRLRNENKRALIGYITAGFPKKESFEELVPFLEKNGLDILEVGVPFSDPIADGPTIQRASQIALTNGVTLKWILQTIQTLREKVALPLVLMSYSNSLLAYGVEQFFRDARKSGVDGLIIPDLIPEEGKLIEQAALKEDIALIYLVSPTTPEDRIRCIAQASHGFLYAVSLTGVTGARQQMPHGVTDFLKRIRKQTDRPLAIGFGISTPAHVRHLRPYVDGVIIGSSLIQHIEQSNKRNLDETARFLAGMKQALNS